MPWAMPQLRPLCRQPRYALQLGVLLSHQVGQAGVSGDPNQGMTIWVQALVKGARLALAYVLWYEVSPGLVLAEHVWLFLGVESD